MAELVGCLGEAVDKEDGAAGFGGRCGCAVDVVEADLLAGWCGNWGDVLGPAGGVDGWGLQ